MRRIAPEAKAVVDYVRHVQVTGPAHIAFDGLRVLHHPEQFARFLSGRGGDVTPVTVELWPSLSCDARCPTCPYRLSGARDEADRTEDLQLLGVEHAREILHGLAAAGVRSVIFTGGGEPLLHPRLLEIVSEAVRAGLAWALFTNGLSLSAELAQRLLQLGPRFLRVSLDAGAAEPYARTYALDSSAFDRVLANVRSAALIALRLESRSFGLSFTLEPERGAVELHAIRNLLRVLCTEVGPGLSLVAFRPRVIHYRGGKPVCPQPRSTAFGDLVEQIQGEIIYPLLPETRSAGTRMDIKQGLFALAAAQTLPTSSLGSSWMTNVDHEGYGYVTAELAGVSDAGQRWGRILNRDDFAEVWAATPRMTLYERLVRGEMTVPPLHRRSPVDAALQGIYEATEGPVDRELAQEVLQEIAQADLMKSTNGDFI